MRLDFTCQPAIDEHLTVPFHRFVCTIIVLVGHGVQGKPNGYVPSKPITHSVWAPEGTTFIQGVEGLLNIVYTFIGYADVYVLYRWCGADSNAPTVTPSSRPSLVT